MHFLNKYYPLLCRKNGNVEVSGFRRWLFFAAVRSVVMLCNVARIALDLHRTIAFIVNKILHSEIGCDMIELDMFIVGCGRCVLHP